MAGLDLAVLYQDSKFGRAVFRNADPDPAFYLSVDPYPDPDPGSQTNADPCGSGSLSDRKNIL